MCETFSAMPHSWTAAALSPPPTMVVPRQAAMARATVEQARTQLQREPRPLPTLKINPEIKDLFAFRYEDFELLDYDPHPHIKAPVAV